MKGHRLLAALIPLLALAAAGLAGEPLTLDVWPGKAPGETGAIGPDKVYLPGPGNKVKAITNVSRPTLTVYRPAKDKDTRAAVVICPGGAYHAVAWDLEGEEVAAWLNSIGVTGIVLKYRVPRRPGISKDAPPPQPLQDAQRGLSLVRGKASAWGLDPHRIGILGFSAGGHLAVAVSTHFQKRSYDSIDDTDKVSCRPDFTVVIYPGYLARKDTAELVPDLHVTKDCPPMFLVHANDDPVSPENSVGLYLALRRAGVPAEMHIYATGGHGFGLRPSTQPVSNWPLRCAEWRRARGILTPQPASR